MKKQKKKTDTGEILPFTPAEAADRDELIVEGLRQNNLKNFCLRLPHNRITAVVGPSGSGKSSLAFDTLFAEGRWRFIESLSTYTRLFLERMDRPELDTIRNIRPAIAIEQKNPVRTSRSTVGTATELNDYLRVLFARAGKVHCTGCGGPVSPSDPTRAADELFKEYAGEKALVGFTIKMDKKKTSFVLDELLKKGFIRVKAGGRVYDISSERPKGRPRELKVIADRLVIKVGDRTRLVESLEVSFREGGGDAWVEVIGKAAKNFSRRFRCTRCNVDIERPSPILFSFNHPVGACPECKGFGNILKYDEEKLVPNRGLSLKDGAIEPWTKPHYRWWYKEMERYAEDCGLDLTKPFSKLTKRERKLVFEGTPEFEGMEGFFQYLESKKYKLHIRVFMSRYKGQFTCPGCNGTRLKKNALAIKIGGLDIAELCRMTIKEARVFFRNLELRPLEKEIAKEALKQIALKLEFLNQTGLGYITLDRLTRTLSGGEAQRVSIANQLASALSGVLYILDEPSIGLHPRDIDMLIQQIKKLSARGNTVVVVEHDHSLIRSADYIVELGPGAGERGGRLVYSGPKTDFLDESNTLTSQYLAGRKAIHTPRWRRNGRQGFVVLRGASGNNLKGVDLKVPLKTLTCITGVSGSGKSTLVTDTLYRAFALRFGLKAERPLPYKNLEGAERILGVKLIDQEPIGRTPRSNPITYIGGFDEIRRFFAALPPAVSGGFAPGSFSFNVPGGRCEACRGEGMEKLEMYFLPDVYTTCGSCSGKRYKPQILEIKCRGKNIFDMLNMTFEEASIFFPATPALSRKFSVMKEVGLGYLRLGQSATTLSGGEAQRLKIARELTDSEPADILYILDEPTTGLHTDDVKRLLTVLGRLVDSGNTVVVVEHNLDCIKTADHIVDLGPEGGEGGGNIVFEGTPEKLGGSKGSYTGRYLKEVLV
jgi:excinuclease ABC subunit A